MLNNPMCHYNGMNKTVQRETLAYQLLIKRFAIEGVQFDG